MKVTGFLGWAGCGRDEGGRNGARCGRDPAGGGAGRAAPWPSAPFGPRPLQRGSRGRDRLAEGPSLSQRAGGARGEAQSLTALSSDPRMGAVPSGRRRAPFLGKLCAAPGR